TRCSGPAAATAPTWEIVDQPTARAAETGDRPIVRAAEIVVGVKGPDRQPVRPGAATVRDEVGAVAGATTPWGMSGPGGRRPWRPSVGGRALAAVVSGAEVGEVVSGWEAEVEVDSGAAAAGASGVAAAAAVVAEVGGPTSRSSTTSRSWAISTTASASIAS